MQVLHFFSKRNLKAFDITRISITLLTVAKLSTVKNSPVFSPTLYYNYVSMVMQTHTMNDTLTDTHIADQCSRPIRTTK